MKRLKLFFLNFSVVILLSSLKISVCLAETLKLSLFSGYLTQVHCRGRLFLSSVGDPRLVQWEAFPKEMGCGVVLKPKGLLGVTDLLLKTSTGDVHLIIEVKKPPADVQPRILEFEVKPTEMD
jgi:hypothetical protein